MTTAAILDFDLLLSPIPGEKPTGVDLRADDSHDSVYWQIKSVRNDSSRIERKHPEDPKNEEYSLSKRRWPEVIELSTKVLAEQAKDYEIAAWLCEALLRQHGFAGLRDGFLLARRMAETFWDGLYPGPKPEDRVAQFAGLFQGALVAPIRQVSITEGTEYGELDFDEARRKGGAVLQQIEQAARQSSTEFLARLVADGQGAIAELDRLAKVLKEKCGKDESGIDLAPPAAPAGLRVDSQSGESTLSWDASAGAAGYYIYGSPLSGGGFVRLSRGPRHGTDFAPRAVPAGTRYFVVTAVDEAGNESAWSSEVMVVLLP